MENFNVGASKFQADCLALAEKIKASGKDFKNIYGIPRGGVPVALVLSHHLGLPIVEDWQLSSLIIDDLIDSGETLSRFAVQTNGEFQNCAVLYGKPHSPKVQFTQEVLKENTWIEFYYENTAKDKEQLITRLLEHIGEDPKREGLKDTPKRVVKMWDEIFGGYQQKEEDFFKAVFTSDLDEMVVVKDIPFYSHCEHHMVPFCGTAHIGYIPNGKVLGLSKMARLVDMYAKRLQIQEVLTKQVADALEKNLKPQGVMVVMEAEHLCMSMRGVRKSGAKTVTSVTLGAFRDQDKTRNEFLRIIK